jgi:hypothetical protein
VLNAEIGRAYPLRAVAMDEDEPSGVVVGERSMGRPREEDEQSRPAAFFFFASERRSNGSWAGAFGRPIWWSRVGLASAVVPLLPWVCRSAPTVSVGRKNVSAWAEKTCYGWEQ